ncbi:DUF2070 family protein [Fervidicoccus sp.]|uniref:DUF2070 family protein n=1 Tax=Fervidicoccus sp. TaxID=2060324 RepID=UPI003D1526D5
MSRVFESSYKLLFGFSAKKLSIASLVITVVISYLRGSLVYFGELAFATGTLYFFRTPFLSLKKIIYISSITVGFVAAFETVLLRPPFTFFLAIPVVTSLILAIIDPKSKSWIIPFILSSLIYYKISMEAMITSLLLAIGIPILRFAFSKISYGIDPFNLFSAFLFSVFGEGEQFEEELKKIGEEKEVDIHLFKLHGEKSRAVAVVSNVHPGPFKGVSGAKLIDFINSEVGKKGYKLLFMHGVGSHENDPASSEDVKKIAEIIGSKLEDGGSLWRSANPCIPGQGIKGDVMVTSLPLDPGPNIHIVSKVKSSMDDIPSSFARMIKENDILVDAQNRFDGDVQWSEEDLKDLISLIDNIKKEKCEDYYIGIGNVSMGDADKTRSEFGQLGISSLVISCSNKKTALLIFDSNNIKVGIRERLVEKLKEKGYDTVEIISTDNHRETGVGRGFGYRVAGERVPFEVIEKKALQAISMAESDMEKKRVEYLKLRVKAKFLGEKGFKLLTSIAMKRSYFASAIFAYIIIAMFLTTLV